MKNKGLPFLVKIAILSLITTFIWVSFEVFTAFTKRPDIEVPPEVLSPIDPTIDQITLDRIVNRIQLSDEEIGDTQLLNADTNQTIPPPLPEDTTDTEIPTATESTEN